MDIGAGSEQEGQVVLLGEPDLRGAMYDGQVMGPEGTMSTCLHPSPHTGFPSQKYVRDGDNRQGPRLFIFEAWGFLGEIVEIM